MFPFASSAGFRPWSDVRLVDIACTFMTESAVGRIFGAAVPTDDTQPASALAAVFRIREILKRALRALHHHFPV
jgi:hypothetical protein